MSVTSNPSSTTAPSTTGGAAARAAGASAAKDALKVAGDAVGAVGGAASRGVGVVANAKPGDWLDKAKGFLNSFSESGGVGNTIGGILGIGAAWFMGNFFGGGIMSTILTAALAIPMMLVGSDTAGGWINGLLGKSGASAATGGQSPTQTTPSVAQNNAAQPSMPQSTVARQAAAQPLAAIAASTGGLTLTNAELLAMVAPADNGRDRVAIFVDPADATRRLQVRSVADSVADGPGIITLAALRNTVGSPSSGIVFGQAVNGAVSVQAAPMGALPNASAVPTR